MESSFCWSFSKKSGLGDSQDPRPRVHCITVSPAQKLRYSLEPKIKYSRSQAKKNDVIHVSSSAKHYRYWFRIHITNLLFPKAKITILNQWVGKHWDLYLKYGIGKTIFFHKTNVKKTATLAHSAKRTLHPTIYFCPLVAPWRSLSLSPRKTKHSWNPSHQK